MAMSGCLDPKQNFAVVLFSLFLAASGCSPVVSHPTVRAETAHLSAQSVRRVEFVHRKQTIFVLEGDKDSSQIRELLSSLQRATWDTRIGKGGGRPDAIQIHPKGGGRAVTIPTDFERIEPLLGSQVEAVLRKLQLAPKADRLP